MVTGLRRGDAARLGPEHVSDGVITTHTEKSGEMVEVHIPTLPQPADALAHGPCGKSTFIGGACRTCFTKESFGNALSEAAGEAGVEKSAHGVRKIGATRAALKGASVAQLNAIFGWSGTKMASPYTQSADRKRPAKGAMEMLALPSPDEKVRVQTLKDEQNHGNIFGMVGGDGLEPPTLSV